VDSPTPICPTCGQPASLALAAPTDQWECRNEACPEFGQVLDPSVDVQYAALEGQTPGAGRRPE
jgi:hypothetical protein